MSNSRILFLAALFAVIAAIAYFLLVKHQQSPIGEQITIYYTKVDGTTEVPWNVTMRPQLKGESVAEHLNNAALYAAVQAVAGPPGTTDAIRFPAGTRVHSVRVTGSTAQVDLSPEVKSSGGGSFGESGEFKALVWTLTALPGIDSVAIRVDGQSLDALPGGHLELDKPLHRSDW